MRGFILGIVIVAAVPAYTAGQQRDRSRASTSRTAVPREQSVRAAPARQSERRAERRTEAEHDANAASDRASADRDRSAAASRERHRSSTTPAEAPVNPGFRTQLNPGFRSELNPGFRTRLNPGFQRVPDREQWHPGQRERYRPRHRPHNDSNVVFVPYAAPVFVEREVIVEREVEGTNAPAFVEPAPPARLILDIHPPTAQVFADGYYIGVPEDFRFEAGGAVLEPGPHRIDILARDYEPVTFDVNLTRGQTATFRQMLAPIVRAAKPAADAASNTPPAAKEPATFYMIPGCYMGNVPPKEANLRPTCDISRAVVVTY